AAINNGLLLPGGVAVDAAGNLYIADRDNFVIRKVDTNGMISNVAGSGANGYRGDGGPATSAALTGLYGLAVDSSFNLYFGDWLTDRIRKVDVTTSTLSFGTLNAGQTSSAQSVTVSDVGNAALDLTSLAVSPNSPFQIVGNGCAAGTTLAVGGTCTVSVAFAPTVAGNPLAD